MDQKFLTLGAYIIASAIIWGAVIVGCSYPLRDTACYEQIQNITAGGVVAHIILVWGPIGMYLRKFMANQSKDRTNKAEYIFA